jgi:DNA-binding SARP family transcriptional activator/predicted ATPase
MQIRLSLFGNFEITLEAKTLNTRDFRHRHPLMVLHMLCVQPNHQIHRDLILDRLWPESTAEGASNRLYNTLHALRRTFAEAGLPEDERIVLLQAGNVMLNPAHQYSVDLHAFSGLIAQARALPKDDPHQLSVQTALLSQASDLYKGELLSGTAYEDWIEPIRLKSKADYVWALEQLAAHSKSEPDVAIGYFQKIIDCEPTNEPAHCALMTLFDGSDRSDKAIFQYSACKRFLQRDLDIAPSLELQNLFRKIVDRSESKHTQASNESAAITSHAARYFAPSNAIPLLGRGEDLDTLRSWITKENTRLISIVGAAGLGKTRLAHTLVEQCQDHFPDGAVAISLTTLLDARQVADQLASALGASNQGESAQARLCRHLSQRSMLILLDRFEHLLPAIGLISELLIAAPKVSFIVTSQAPLRTAAERVYELPSLMARNTEGATLLFEQVARNLGVDVQFEKPTERTKITEICRRLGGNALAIELAAGQTQVLSLANLLRGLEASLDLLTSQGRDVEVQHRSLKDAIEWSFRLLDQETQAVFSMLAVFTAPFTLEDATNVLTTIVDRQRVTGAIRSLLDRHLLSRHCIPLSETKDSSLGADSEVRFTYLDSVMMFAKASLRLSPQFQSLQKSHAEYFAHKTALCYDLVLEYKNARALSQYRVIMYDVSQALKWFEANATTLARLSFMRSSGHLSLLAGLFDQTIQHTQSISTIEHTLSQPEKVELAWCTLMLARANFGLGEYEIYERYFKNAETLSKSCDDSLLSEGVALRRLSYLTRQLQFQEAYAEAKRLYTSTKSTGSGALKSCNYAIWLAHVAQICGKYPEAKSLALRAVDFALRERHPDLAANAFLNLAESELRMGNCAEARASITECLGFGANGLPPYPLFAARILEMSIDLDTLDLSSALKKIRILKSDSNIAHTEKLRKILDAVWEVVLYERDISETDTSLRTLQPLLDFDINFADIFVRLWCYRLRVQISHSNWKGVEECFSRLEPLLSESDNALWYAWLLEATAHAMLAAGAQTVANDAAKLSKALMQDAGLSLTPRHERSLAFFRLEQASNRKRRSSALSSFHAWKGPQSDSVQLVKTCIRRSMGVGI